MRIGDAAAAVGATPRALRFYEQRGLLPPPARTSTGQRDYSAADIDVLRAIRALLSTGLTVEDVHHIADRLPLLAVAPSCTPPSGSTGAGGRDVVRRRIAALDAEIGRLTRLRDALRTATGEAEGATSR
ncbi:MerR family transcriptional regulator [Streptomyces roseirectus]|uniref:MerR family transcriptional regulator n=1 Tax=Streptomyces roseirectus TaxID=2768066 RepID=A0A7H0IGJ0_9ACTN|nr:MerR family transcriptional regulator [Streptomyces roseirectus]QNP71906.1 MerR family transcriptional regulator [Streptomyces roseirectus]